MDKSITLAMIGMALLTVSLILKEVHNKTSFEPDVVIECIQTTTGLACKSVK